MNKAITEKKWSSGGPLNGVLYENFEALKYDMG